VGRWSDPGRYRNPQHGHRAVYDSIIKREAARAEALMHEHVYQARLMVKTVLENLTPQYEIRLPEAIGAIAANQ
jgi:DNA-binding GntR family transcriptional regulator